MKTTNDLQIANGSRRRMLRLATGVCVGFGATRFHLLPAAELQHLSAANPAAVALGYTEDAAHVDAQKFPKHQPGQQCANCKYFQGNPNAQYAPCQLYPGNAVNANGWCSGYVAK